MSVYLWCLLRSLRKKFAKRPAYSHFDDYYGQEVEIIIIIPFLR